jgi:simple sugar transport system substrate-binding protein
MWLNDTRDSGRRRTGGRGGRRLLIGAPVFAAALAVAACSGGGGSSTGSTSGGQASAASGQASAASAASGQGAGGSVRIFVVGGESSDPFWSQVKRGAQAAGAAFASQGASVTWLGPQNYNNLGPDAAQLLRTALSESPSAVVGPDWVPAAEDPAFKAVTAAHVPLIIYNAGGISEATKAGALAYIGTDDYQAGVGGGKAFGSAGVKHVLCVNTLPGESESEARCSGIKSGLASSDGGKVTELELSASNFGNPTAVAQGIKAALLKDSSIDGVITISVTDADSAFAALQQASLTGKVKLGTFDVDSTQLNRIKAGQQLFAIDQQGYLQGYYAVTELFTYVKWGMLLPSNNILTGPLIIDSGNVSLAIAGAAAGVRLSPGRVAHGAQQRDWRHPAGSE